MQFLLLSLQTLGIRFVRIPANGFACVDDIFQVFTFYFFSRSSNLDKTNERNELNANLETKLMGLKLEFLISDAIQHLVTLDYESGGSKRRVKTSRTRLYIQNETGAIVSKNE